MTGDRGPPGDPWGVRSVARVAQRGARTVEHRVVGHEQVVGCVPRRLDVEGDPLVGVPHRVVVDPDVGPAVVVDAAGVLRLGGARRSAPPPIGAVRPRVDVRHHVVRHDAVARLAGSCPPADGVDADVVGVVDAVGRDEEVGDVPVHCDGLALPGPGVRDRVAFDDDVLEGALGAVAVGEDRDPVGADVGIAALALRAVHRVRRVDDVAHRVVEEVDPAARVVAMEEAGRGVAGVVADLDEDPRGGECGAGRAVAADREPLHCDIARACDAHRAGIASCVVERAHVPRVRGTQAEPGRPTRRGGDREQCSRVLPPHVDGAPERPREAEDLGRPHPVLHVGDGGVDRCGGGAGSRVEDAAAAWPRAERAPVRRGGIGDQAVAVGRHCPAGLDREIRRGHRRLQRAAGGLGRRRRDAGRRAQHGQHGQDGEHGRGDQGAEHAAGGRARRDAARPGHGSWRSRAPVPQGLSRRSVIGRGSRRAVGRPW